MDIERSLNGNDILLIEKIKASMVKEDEVLTTSNLYENLPRAAVSSILRPDSLNHELVMLFLKRNARVDDPWSGHIAFPGGRFIKQDRDILSTAARELMEEAGIDMRQCEILGTLNEVIPSSLRSIRVTPFVVLAPENVDVSLDHNEIERFFWIPVSYFRDQMNIRPHAIVRFGVKTEVSSYKFFKDYVIWGLTFRVIQDLIERIERESPK